jgi:DNA replicative helicase MCM subunit Mcm2 (Cdc46/Mcm family)
MTKITSKVCSKLYRCCHCGHEHYVSTNHYGEVYSDCPKCQWKWPMDPGRHECLEPLPEGMKKPESWKIVKLGDLLK